MVPRRLSVGHLCRHRRRGVIIVVRVIDVIGEIVVGIEVADDERDIRGHGQDRGRGHGHVRDRRERVGIQEERDVVVAGVVVGVDDVMIPIDVGGIIVDQVELSIRNGREVEVSLRIHQSKRYKKRDFFFNFVNFWYLKRFI